MIQFIPVNKLWSWFIFNSNLHVCKYCAHSFWATPIFRSWRNLLIWRKLASLAHTNLGLASIRQAI